MLRADDARSEPSVYGDSVRDVNVWRTKMRKSSSGTLESYGASTPTPRTWLAQYAHATLHSLKQKPNPARRYREFTTLHGDAASLIPGTRSFQFHAPPPPTPPAPRILSLQFRHRPLPFSPLLPPFSFPLSLLSLFPPCLERSEHMPQALARASSRTCIARARPLQPARSRRAHYCPALRHRGSPTLEAGPTTPDDRSCLQAESTHRP